MATLPPAGERSRFVTLDVVRGIAVMGILAMNIVAFAMPFPAYFSPLAATARDGLDGIVYTLNFIFIDGKMRGLFSFLFGASLLLVIERARAAGASAASITYRRLFWLLVIGCIHFYLIWFGDILISYALTGMVAFLFRNQSVRALLVWGGMLILLQTLLMAGSTQQAHALFAAASAPDASAAAIAAWNDFAGDFQASPERLRELTALHLGPWIGLAREQLIEHTTEPLFFAFLFGPETLAYMLFGMAALKTGYLTGSWPDASYRKVAIACLAIGIPVYALVAWLLVADGFTVPGLFTWYMTATTPFRPLMIVAYAALIILATRKGGWLVDRIAATGRAAFTNYLGTSILMTFVFYGWGLGYYGAFSRAELWLVVIAMWAIMLAWSKPWLDRFAYGPLEWLWRSLSQMRLQPMRKSPPAVAGRD